MTIYDNGELFRVMAKIPFNIKAHSYTRPLNRDMGLAELKTDKRIDLLSNGFIRENEKLILLLIPLVIKPIIAAYCKFPLEHFNTSLNNLFYILRTINLYNIFIKCQ